MSAGSRVAKIPIKHQASVDDGASHREEGGVVGLPQR